MQNLLETDDFSSLLLQQEPYFPKDKTIINFIQKQPHIIKKPCIGAWHENHYDRQSSIERQVYLYPKVQNKKKRIENFLSKVKIDNAQITQMSEQFKNNKKMSSLDYYDTQKLELFLPLNKTLITFPKSRSQNRKPQNQVNIMLQNLYRKRQKSNVIPKEILINSKINNSTNKNSFPKKNYLCKNRAFIQQNSLTNVYNPESKPIKELSGLRRRFSSSCNKKSNNVFHFQEGKKQKLLILEYKTDQIDKNKRNQQNSSQINFLKNQKEKSPHKKMFKALYSSPKFNNIYLRCERVLSISKLKEDAQISHINRMKFEQKSDIQLLGSTIAKWKGQAQKRLQKALQIRE